MVRPLAARGVRGDMPLSNATFAARRGMVHNPSNEEDRWRTLSILTNGAGPAGELVTGWSAGGVPPWRGWLNDCVVLREVRRRLEPGGRRSP